jgi:hypothetical protein
MKRNYQKGRNPVQEVPQNVIIDGTAKEIILTKEQIVTPELTRSRIPVTILCLHFHISVILYRKCGINIAYAIF